MHDFLLSSQDRISGDYSAFWAARDYLGKVDRTAANLTAVLVDYGPSGQAMVTRGWLDPQNRDSLARSERVEPGRSYDLRWDLQPDDHVFAPGHRSGLVVVSTDHDYTIRPKPGTRLTLAPHDSSISLPVVGGADALR